MAVGTDTQLKVPFLDLRLQMANLGDALQDAVWSACESCAFIQGKPVLDLEASYAAYCGVTEAIAVDSGTAALHLALHVLGIGRGDEVVVPTNTFIASVAPVHTVGANPVFVDADPSTWQMDLNQLESAIGPLCRAVIAVHLYGQPLPMKELHDICERKGVFLIEDAAQAHGARYCGQRTGTFGIMAAFSFYPGKNLGAYGDGGMITTNDTAIAKRLRSLRDHGRITKYEHAEIGFNYRMDSVQGAVLNVKLPFLDEWNEGRRRWAASYRQRLSTTRLTLPSLVSGTEPVYHLFAARSPNRDDLLPFLASRGIETGVHYPIPLHLQPAFSFLGHKPGDFPVAEAIGNEVFSLPIFPEMNDLQFEHVCDSIDEFFAANH
jgi:dTDP-4-amino-4,6-dideoxygalactose transaminase